MATIFGRKMLQIGDSLGITIPEEIIKTYNLKKGNKIFLIADGLDDADGFLLIDLMDRDINELWKLMREIK